MRFLVDAQLPPGLAHFFSDAGFEAEHVFHAQLLNATDRAIAAHALKTNAIIVTKDEDSVLMRRFLRRAPRVLWIRSGNVTSRVLVARLRPLLPEIIAALEGGEDIVEIR